MKFYSLLFCLVSYVGLAQKQFVTVDYNSAEVLRAENIVHISIPFVIEEGIHIQDINNTKENLIATTVSLRNSSVFNVTDYSYQDITYEYIILDGVEHKVISGAFVLEIEVELKQQTVNSHTLNGQLYYQSCNDKQCFFPRTLSFEISF